MEQLQERCTSALQNTQGLFTEATAQADMKIKNLKRDLQETADSDRTAYQKMITRLNDDTNNLQLKIDEINKGISRFTAQTGLFDKAEQLRKQLDASIEGLREKINGFATYEAKVINLKNQMDQIQKIASEVDSRAANYTNQKNQLDSLDQKYSRIIALSNSMDEKLAELNTSSDNIVRMQQTLRGFENSISGIQAQYDRIENKSQIIEKVSNNINDTADRIFELEKRLGVCNNQLNTMPDQVEELQAGIKKIMDNNGSINEAVDKLSSLQKIFDETESRIDDLNDRIDEISGTEERLQRLTEKAENQIDDLRVLGKSSGTKRKESSAAKSKGGKGGLTPALKSSVRSLKERGWKNEEIADNLGIAEDLVELILEAPSSDDE